MGALVNETGLTVIHEPNSGSPIADIILVHGLQGHPYRTWACKVPYRAVSSTAHSSIETPEDGNGGRNSYYRRLSRKFSGSSSHRSPSSHKSWGASRGGEDAKETQVFWPKDMLPIQYPNARILVYGYDTKATHYLSQPTNANAIHTHGKDLLASVAASRKLYCRLIFIAHSLGGIVVKEMLASSSNSAEDRLQNVVDSTAAVVFLGTPHRGSPDLAKLGDRARSMVNAFRIKTNPALLDALRLKTNDLERARELFSAVWNRHDFRVKTFQEGLGFSGLDFGPFGKKVVPDWSSLLGDSRERAGTIQANHMEMCRFIGLDDPNYGRIRGEITAIYDWLAGNNASRAHYLDGCPFTAYPLARPPVKSRAKCMDEREKSWLQSLGFPNMNQRAQNLEAPAEGTCSWFFKHETFVDWFTHKKQDHFCGLLWLKGKPGSGKSTLLKEVFVRTAEMSGSECHVASFFFNAKGDGLEHSLNGMLRSIIHQMCSQDLYLLEALLYFTQGRHAFGREALPLWDNAELRAFFKAAILGHKKKSIVFIDAIDECDADSVRDVADFWREMTKTAHRAGVQLSVCLSSRHFPAIAVNDCPEIIMENHNRSEIVEFVRWRLDLGMTGEDTDHQVIKEKIVQKSGGVFLWVSLVVRDILQKHDEGNGLRILLKHLDSVPRELEELFCQMLTAVPLSTALAKMFQWAFLSARPLRLHEWHHILAFIGDTIPSSLHQWRQSDYYTENDAQLEKRITHLSRGLLGFSTRSSNDESKETDWDFMSDRAGAGSLDMNTGETRVLQATHESVRQFFLEGSGFVILDPASGKDPLAHAHLSIMNVCLDYIQIEELDSLVQARKLAQQRRTRSVASFGSAGSHDRRKNSPRPKMRHREIRTERANPGNSARSRISQESANRLKSCNLKKLEESYQDHDATSLWLENGFLNDLDSCDVTASLSQPRSSAVGGSQVLEAHPALLSYATCEVFTHAQKANTGDLDPSPVVERLRNGAWDRWKSLRELEDDRTGFLYFAVELGLFFWLKARYAWRVSEVISPMELAIGNKDHRVLGTLLNAFPSVGYGRQTSQTIIAFLASPTEAVLLQAYLSAYLSEHLSHEHDPMDSIIAKEPWKTYWLTRTETEGLFCTSQPHRKTEPAFWCSSKTVLMCRRSIASFARPCI